MFWRAVEKLKAAGVRRTSLVPEGVKDEEESGGESEQSFKGADGAANEEEIDAFWPPLDAVDDEASGSEDW